MAVKPQDVNATEDKMDVKKEEFKGEFDSELFQEVALIREEMTTFRKKFQFMFTEIESTNRRLERTVDKIDKTATFFTDKRIAAQNTILSGVGGQIRIIGDELRQRIDNVSLRYENYLEKITKKAEADERDGVTFKVTKNIAESAKAGILWVLFFGVLFALIEIFFLQKMK